MDPAEYLRLDATEERLWWFGALHGRLIDQLARLPEGARVLDAGCGTGGFLGRLGRARPDLLRFGVELEPGVARRAAAKSGALVAGGSLLALPFASQAFDAIASSDVLCHEAVEEQGALAELRRCLRPGGMLLLNLPAYPWLASAHDRAVHNARRYTRGSLRALLHAGGFEAVRAWHWNSLLFPAMILQRKVLARNQASSDVAPLPPYLDASFRAVSEVERRAARALVDLPWGGSVMATARAPGS